MPSVVCPRCARTLLPPTLVEHDYRCPLHGRVAGLASAIRFHAAQVAGLARRSEVPIWYPAPMPDNWLFTGLRWAETPRRKAEAVVVAVSGKGLTEGPTDVVIVAEQPGCGLGATYAGIHEPDPDASCFAGPAAARVRTGHRATGLWSVDTPGDRVAFVGEADGDWLWIIGWPDSAWSLVTDDLRLADGRVDDSYSQFGVGAINPRLMASERHDAT